MRSDWQESLIPLLLLLALSVPALYKIEISIVTAQSIPVGRVFVAMVVSFTVRAVPCFTFSLIINN